MQDRRDVRVGAGPDILEIAQQHVYLAQHLGRRIQLRAVQTVDRQAGGGVGGVADLGLVEVAPEAVLRTEDRHQLHPAFQQGLHVTAATHVHASLIGQQPNSTVGNEMR